MKTSTILRLAAILALAGGGAAAFFFLPWKEQFKAFLEWTQGLGVWAPVLIGAMYVPACLLFIPGSILTMGAGVVCGVLKGTIAVSLGSVAGASLCFFAGRTLLRGWIEAKVSKNEKFHAIDQAVEKEGFKIVLLTRLSPVFPFNLLNYSFGLTKVRFRDYFFGSWIGMLPGTVTYVYLGSAVSNLAQIVAGEVEGGTGQLVLFGAGLVATIGVTIFITRIAKRAIANAVPPETPAEGAPAAEAPAAE